MIRYNSSLPSGTSLSEYCVRPSPFALCLALLSAFLLWTGELFADTLFLKDRREVKGLVVEEHEDRVLFSTSEGEETHRRKDIDRIEYDEPEYNFLNLGRQMEKKKKWGEALSFYERALAANPELREAKQAVLGLRSRMWARSTEGPVSEVAKQQEMEDAWRSHAEFGQLAPHEPANPGKLLWERLGLELGVSGDWVVIQKVRKGSAFPHDSFTKGDAVAAIDGQSMRFFDPKVVVQRLLEPRYSNAILQIRRPLTVEGPSKRLSFKDLGLNIQQKYNGLTVTKIAGGSPAEKGGFHAGDLIEVIQDKPTRYLSLRDTARLLEEAPEPVIQFVINRSVNITRK